MRQHLRVFDDKRVKIWKGIVLVTFLLSGIGILVSYYLQLRKETSKIDLPEETPLLVMSSDVSSQIEEPSSADAIESVKWMVDIKGEVASPGTYYVDSSMRVIDALTLAGGITKQGDTSWLNLSKKVEDQMVIIVYNKKEVTSFTEMKEKKEQALEGCKTLSEIENDACIESNHLASNETSEKGFAVAPTKSIIDINRATKEELMTLPGIGEAKAEAILAYRKEKSFQKIEELLEVKGIGESVFEALKDQITISS